MGGNRNGKNFTIHTRFDGRREFFQHDDRGYSGNNYRNTGGRQKFSGKGGQPFQSSSGYGRHRGQPHYRGGPSRKCLLDDDVHMGGEEKGNRYQQFYEQVKGSRRIKKNRGRPVINNISGWHKMLIREAASYPKEVVLTTIKELVNDDFVPVMMETEGYHLVFYLEKNAGVAKAILNLSGRLTLGNNHRISISCSDTAPPLRKLTPPQIERIKVVMSDRYSVEMKRLDLKNFHNDKTLVSEQIFCPLYRHNFIVTVFEILMSNCSLVEEIDLSNNQLLTMNDMGPLKNCLNLKRLFLEKNKMKYIEVLQKVKGLPITELTLEGNPLCDKFKNGDTYTSAVREIFPKVERLDGMDLPKPIGFEVEDEANLPPTRPSFFYSATIKNIVVEFIDQYYQVFESENRKPLEAAYTEDALFSIASNFPENGIGARYAGWIEKESRNLKKVTNPEKRRSQLFRGRNAVATVLCRLPKCIHDPNSFIIDIPIAKPCLMHVVLTGVFKQLVDKNPPYRSFMKSMVIVPVGGGFCISNEELYINTATVEQIRKAFKEPVQAIAASFPPQVASTSSVPVSPPQSSASQSQMANLEPAQIELVKQFVLNSKMLPEYCKMCLERNDWDFAKAGEMFLGLQKENKIPPEYFGVPT